MATSRRVSALVSSSDHNHDKRYLTKNKMTQTEIKPSDVYFDDVNVNVDTGSAFGILSCVDFSPGDNGSVWLHFDLDDSFLTERDINFDLVYTLNGDDNGKNVALEAQIWIVGNGETPAEGSPQATLVENIVSSITNTNKKVRVELSTIMLTNSFIGSVNSTLSVKLTRKSTSTYGGTFKMISFLAKQLWTEIL